MTDRDATRVWEFRPHWVVLVRPLLFALIGVAIFIFGRQFATSRHGESLIDEFIRAAQPLLGEDGTRTLLKSAEPLSIALLALFFGLPLLGALIRRASTSITVDGWQIIFRRGILARAITQVEIGEVVGVNVTQTVLGRLLGFGTIDVETRGEDRLFVRGIGDARGFAGLVLDSKRRFGAR